VRDYLRRVPDAETMRALGRDLARHLPAGACVLLTGPLGAGKTTLVQGIASGLGVAGAVASPTFVLVREHAGRGGRPGLVHMDFYRLSTAREVAELGLDDYLAGPDVIVIEWAERAASALPGDALWVEIVPQGEARDVVVRPAGTQAAAIARAWLAPTGAEVGDHAGVAGD
jgi:tRNA threonylcarbamoyladenosine biosynthesis protein TsaE